MSEENDHSPIIIYFFIAPILVFCGCQLFLKYILNRRRAVPNSQVIFNDSQDIEVTNVLHQHNIINDLDNFSLILDKNKINKDDECIICSELLSEKQIRILKCTHQFHQECIDSWILTCQKLECPVCCTDISQLNENIV